MRYVVDFGSANSGGTPAFTLFVRLDTLAAVLPQPTIGEVGGGQYYFDLDWSTTTATSISFKMELAGIEQSDVISSPDVLLPGDTVASAATSSLTGYQQCGVIVARALVQCGVLNLNPQDQASYDPFAETDPNVVQALELLNDLGAELVGKVNKHLRRKYTFTTSGSALSYGLPADYMETVDGTGWDLSNTMPLDGAVSAQYAAFVEAWNGSAVVNIPYRIQGNRLTFPVDPGDGKSISFEYVSNYWVQTAASGSGPDSHHVTLSTDYVLYDPTLIVRGLKLRFLEAKGFDTLKAQEQFNERLEYVKGTNTGGRRLSTTGPRSRFNFIGSDNAPDQGLGQ